MSELEQVNGGLGFKKKFLFQSLVQVLGYDDCYDSGTCPLDLGVLDADTALQSATEFYSTHNLK